MKIINDPIPYIFKSFKKLFPDIMVDIQYTDQLDGCGCTTIPDDNNEIPLIDISFTIPISALPEILSHELAHVVHPNNEHDKEWEETFDLIFNTAQEICDQEYTSYKNKST